MTISHDVLGLVPQPCWLVHSTTTCEPSTSSAPCGTIVHNTIAVAQLHGVLVSLPCFQGDNTYGPHSPRAQLEVWGTHIRPAKSKQMNLLETTMQRSKRQITQVKRGALDGELTITQVGHPAWCAEEVGKGTLALFCESNSLLPLFLLTFFSQFRSLDPRGACM